MKQLHIFWELLQDLYFFAQFGGWKINYHVMKTNFEITSCGLCLFEPCQILSFWGFKSIMLKKSDLSLKLKIPTTIKVASSIYVVGFPPIWLVIQPLHRRQGKVGEIPTTSLSVHYVVDSLKTLF